MYDYIKGQVTRITPEYLTLEQHGIGYQLALPNPYVFSISSEEVQIYTYLHVREDAQILFGFPNVQEREVFRKLLQVSGIGPKGALAILATGQPSHVVDAIEREDEGFLVKFPGVGKKTARQMILDLKGKLGELTSAIPTEGIFMEEHIGGKVDNPSLEEALLALTALGYSEKELAKVKPILEEIEASSTDAYMKKALQLLLKLS
ncbi:Holliday junction branch migration protein RuvA [Paenisporosarcina cavernae]|uniref:Holliday junction branch migration complex subunit RuvA n=1 Tax=Paenisporosarcina cavernae TaxID=2320858 RepID=A0A385YW52_9BACL|nr:Holliday junction branch migration protein RuvA [Paenisporosarcina cavernae]AYC29732.1 Holliday junction branch migration protein RuvA [Paenisporosarcina cavernae]